MSGQHAQVKRDEIDVPFTWATFRVHEVEVGPRFLSVRFFCHGELIWTNVRKYDWNDRRYFRSWAKIMGHLVM